MAILSLHNGRDTSRRSSVASTTATTATTATTTTSGDEAMETKALWIQLDRLLYCMETTDTSVSPSTPSSSYHQPSWQSLLMRAQMCQDLYQQFLQETSASTSNLAALATTSLAQRVDRACRRSQEMAEVLRIREQEEEQQHQQQPDLIDQIFFAPRVSQQMMDLGTPDLVSEEEEGIASTLLETFEEDDDAQDTNDYSSSRRTDTGTRTEEPSTEELQQLQREQMEDAIGIMAAQMREATQQIQSQLQRQNKDTLSQLETVTEQTAEDVTQLTQRVQDHNSQRGWFSSSSGSAMSMWKLWLMIAIVFFVSVALIGTIPKRSNTCFLLCRKTDTSLFGWFILSPIRMVMGDDVVQLPSWSIYSLFGSDASDTNEASPDSIHNNDSSYWDNLYEDDDEERMEKQKLEKLMSSFQEPEEKEETPQKADVRQIDWRLAMEEENDSEGYDPFDAYNPIEKGGKKNKDKVKRATEADPFDAFQPVQRDGGKAQDKPDPFDAFKPVDRVNKKQNEEVKRDAAADPFSAFKPVDHGGKKQDASRDPFEAFKPVETEKEKKEEADPDPFNAFKPVERGTKKAKARMEEQQKEKKPTLDEHPKVDESEQETGVVKDNTKVQPNVEEPKLSVEDVNLDDLLASLHNAEKHSQEDIEAEMVTEDKKVYDPHGMEDVSGEVPDEDDGFLSRQGVAKMRISPRDVRAAADVGQADKLESYLQLQPSFVDRVDRNNWSALHLAARGGHLKVVELLVDRFGSDISLRTNKDQTPLDIAIARHGENHPVTKALQRAVHGEAAVPEERQKPRDETRKETKQPEDSVHARPSKLELKKQALLRALASDDDFDSLETYMEEGRKKLDNPHVVKPVKQLLTRDDEPESMDSYVEAGRNRLEAILGTTGSGSMREEL